jgi:hypothetical protein
MGDRVVSSLSEDETPPVVMEIRGVNQTVEIY